MLKTDLLPVLNAEATHLGVKPVDDRMWRDWIDEDLIEEPKPKGRKRGENPLWEYSSGTTKRALTVLRLKAGGVTRFSAIRLRLWLNGHELPQSRINKDLRSEFARLLRKNFFRQPWSYDANDPNADASPPGSRNGCFEPGFRRENERAPARTRPLAKPYPCVELGACVHHANDGKAIRPQAIMGRQKSLWYVEESVEGAHPDTSQRSIWHRGCVST